MPLTAENSIAPRVVSISLTRLRPSRYSQSIYGDSAVLTDDLLPSVQDHGILVPLVVTAGVEPGTWEVISGHRRLACALTLGLKKIPCETRSFPSDVIRRLAILEYNRQRQKNFSQSMREADALAELWITQANSRRLANLRRDKHKPNSTFADVESLTSDTRWDQKNLTAVDVTRDCGMRMDRGRTDVRIARRLGLGGKDLYRQARAIWQLAQSGDDRAKNAVAQLDAGTKTIYAAYKDLRRRDRFSADFRPTPYDVWSFRHDRAFGIPHAGSIPAAIIAHTLFYYTQPDALVVDPMAGGGSTLDVCESMGRRCLAYDIAAGPRADRAT